MGSIYHYRCTNCTKIAGEIFYGKGMSYPETNMDMRLFACEDCGEVFSRNINKKFNRCPRCAKKPKEIKLFETDDDGYIEERKTAINCPNCKVGRIQMAKVGLWD